VWFAYRDTDRSIVVLLEVDPQMPHHSTSTSAWSG
jgi:hypothetical protein